MPKTNGTKGTAKKQWDNEFPIDPYTQSERAKGAKKKKPKTKKKKLGHTCKYKNNYVIYANYEYNKKPVFEVKNQTCQICGRIKYKQSFQYSYLKRKGEYEAVSLSTATSLRVFYEKHNWKKELTDEMEKFYGKRTMAFIFGEGKVSQVASEDPSDWKDIFKLNEGTFILSEPADGYMADLEMWNTYLVELKVKNDEMKAKWYKEMEENER